VIIDRGILFSVIFILFQILISGCEFSPDKVPVTQVDSPEEQGPPIQVSLNNRYDTIKIGWETNFSYKVTGTNNRINSVLVTLGEDELNHYIRESG
jgi:hypothetical protein